MRFSRLMLVTLRDIPSDAEIASHQLLLRGGFVRRVAPGIYAYMPLMWKVLRKIIKIVQAEMDAAGAHETLLPQLHPAELWQKSGRWHEYTAGEGIMFHLKDRQGRELGLGPTHEEVITSLAGDLLKSYRQLPATLYQIQSKFRDEIRPRFGLMRSREFIMKDAYSFHSNSKDLEKFYSIMDKTYRTIFNNCGIETVAVQADSGAIGGASSQEFMVTAQSGEDLILTSPDGAYAANQEKAVSEPIKATPLASKEKISTIKTPSAGSIQEVCLALGINQTQIIKVLVMTARLESGEVQPLLLSLRGDQELNEVKLSNILRDIFGENILKISLITKDEIKKQGLNDLPFGAIGPNLEDKNLEGAFTWRKKFLRLADHTAANLTCFACGSNLKNFHLLGTSWGNLGEAPKVVDIRNAKAGDNCIHDNQQKLEEKRGIEVGHIFQLGRKYSQSLNAEFTNESGRQEPFWMGCYGIGISRLAQAAVEQNHDNFGIKWPLNIAPFEVIVVIANLKDDVQRNAGEDFYSRLKEEGIDALIDDRAERAGVKFKDADLIGIPWRVVVGRDAANGLVEVVKRATSETKKMETNEALRELIKEIHALKL
ncbi:proline--tRNA ligase [Prochlorococcus sp. MIT 1300]|uniref:proline--tRNA ligase n=1 Tax=Prochlorococcus sp. MIT 1300 TaxID=3096218 RepID=UPI002A75ED63|nr:proline--tRNA ligase [Prochlorococcus sp. MIT 1300]